MPCVISARGEAAGTRGKPFAPEATFARTWQDFHGDMVIRKLPPPTEKTPPVSKRGHVITRASGRFKAADEKRRCKQAAHCDGDKGVRKELQTSEKTPLGSKHGHVVTRSSGRRSKAATKKRRCQQSAESDDGMEIHDLQQALQEIRLGSKLYHVSTRFNGHPSKAADDKRRWQHAPVSNAFSAGSSSTFIPKPQVLDVIQAVETVDKLEVYTMERKPRGMCYIIYNQEIGGHSIQQEAAKNDAKNMKSLFTELGFNVIEKSNLTAGGILLQLVFASDAEELENADCLVVILILPGNKDVIRGADGEELYLWRQVYPLFNEVNCPDLQGKPKLFFVQTYENSHVDGRTMNAPISAAPDAGLDYCPSRWSDMYCAHGTISRNVSLRKTETGTWFLSAVYSVFSQHAHKNDLNELMQRVTDVMTQRSAARTQRQILNICPNELKKKLYFNPRL